MARRRCSKRVTFNDPAAKDKARQTLYMFFTLPGHFIAANFTGG